MKKKSNTNASSSSRPPSMELDDFPQDNTKDWVHTPSTTDPQFAAEDGLLTRIFHSSSLIEDYISEESQNPFPMIEIKEDNLGPFNSLAPSVQETLDDMDLESFHRAQELEVMVEECLPDQGLPSSHEITEENDEIPLNVIEETGLPCNEISVDIDDDSLQPLVDDSPLSRTYAVYNLDNATLYYDIEPETPRNTGNRPIMSRSSLMSCCCGLCEVMCNLINWFRNRSRTDPRNKRHVL